MRKINNLLLAIIFTLGITFVLSSCNSKSEYTRNPDYTYGTYENDDIESIYTLNGNPEQYYMEDYSDGVSKGSQGSYFINVCTTDDGGIIAYGDGLYVYSPDKNDKNSVKNALISECMQRN